MHIFALLQGILLASILITAVPATFLLISLIMWFIVLAAYNTNNKKQEVEVRQFPGSYKTYRVSI